MKNLYQAYKSHLQKIADVNGACALLQWDQEVFMPQFSAESRARQISTLSSWAHELKCDNKLLLLVEKLLVSLPKESREYLNVKRTFEDLEKYRKVPASHVEQLSKAISEAFNAWEDARKKNDFKLFKPHLQKVLGLKMKESELKGTFNHPYDGALYDYDNGRTTAELDDIFNSLKYALGDILNQILILQPQKDDLLQQKFSKKQQWELGKEISKKLGFCFDNGRKDLSTHPFTISMAANDVRITTRIDENNFMEMLWSTIHEVGHALYEQGLSKDDYGLPGGEACSISIHESQSRFYENNLGKSADFLSYIWPGLQKKFSKQLNGFSIADFSKAVNHIVPGLIRTNADELTYHFHIIIRYEIEKGLFEERFAVSDLPEIWESYYQEYLGIKPTSHVNGILQDVHWAHGSFGYFPTYSIGSLYAAQIEQKLIRDLSNFKSLISTGQFNPIHQWFADNLYNLGRLHDSEALCEITTGEKLKPEYFLNYIKQKYSDLYNVKIKNLNNVLSS